MIRYYACEMITVKLEDGKEYTWKVGEEFTKREICVIKNDFITITFADECLANDNGNLLEMTDGRIYLLNKLHYIDFDLISDSMKLTEYEKIPIMKKLPYGEIHIYMADVDTELSDFE